MLKNVVEKMNILMTISNPFITATRELKDLVEKRVLVPTSRGEKRSKISIQMMRK